MRGHDLEGTKSQTHDSVYFFVSRSSYLFNVRSRSVKEKKMHAVVALLKATAVTLLLIS